MLLLKRIVVSKKKKYIKCDKNPWGDKEKIK